MNDHPVLSMNTAPEAAKDDMCDADGRPAVLDVIPNCSAFQASGVC
ncbi:hypothetical protein [Halostagnicola sp. A-GB9-2]|nr:hypothetical protein [Halostagnicola sp. A-GB9-2]MDJ1434716.1 hypothetical protein [Halostagnicola sp. A-GB9-2]